MIWKFPQNVFLMLKYFYQEDAVCPSSRRCYSEGGMVKVPLSTSWCLLHGVGSSRAVPFPFVFPIQAVALKALWMP